MRHGRFDPCPSHVTDKTMDLSDVSPTPQDEVVLTVKLTATSVAALNAAAKIKEMSHTDVVNKALAIYLIVMMTEDLGSEYYFKGANGDYKLVTFSEM